MLIFQEKIEKLKIKTFFFAFRLQLSETQSKLLKVRTFEDLKKTWTGLGVAALGIDFEICLASNIAENPILASVFASLSSPTTRDGASPKV